MLGIRRSVRLIFTASTVRPNLRALDRSERVPSSTSSSLVQRRLVGLNGGMPSRIRRPMLPDRHHGAVQLPRQMFIAHRADEPLFSLGLETPRPTERRDLEMLPLTLHLRRPAPDPSSDHFILVGARQSQLFLSPLNELLDGTWSWPLVPLGRSTEQPPQFPAHSSVCDAHVSSGGCGSACGAICTQMFTTSVAARKAGLAADAAAVQGI